jgi:hypothetical protein
MKLIEIYFNYRKAEKGLATVQKNFSEAKNMQFDSRIISYGNLK